MSFGNLLKQIDSVLYSQFLLERYKGTNSKQVPHTKVREVFDFTKKSKEIIIDSNITKLKSIDKLAEDHPARKYCVNRKIEQLDLLYFAPKFKKYTNSVVPNKFDTESLERDHPRLIIPFFDVHGKMIAFQARAFGDEQPKYFTIKIDSDEEKLFGLERVDFGKTIYITEGPLDSLFVDNCLAVSGSSFDTPAVRTLKSRCILIMDNEPRNLEIMKQLRKYIDLGYKVFMWPDTIDPNEIKDINDLVKSGYTREDIMAVLSENVFVGAEAKLRYSQWRKV